MRKILMRGACLLAAWLALAPALVWGQSVDVIPYTPASPQVPIPYGNPRPEDGGFYVWGGFTMFHLQNPLKSQVVMQSGFRILDNSFPGVPPGTFIGTGIPRLNVDQLTGADTWLPGTEVGIGWKFKDGSALELNWTYLSQAHYRAGATLLPQFGLVGDRLQNTFLYADVFNIPPEYAGPDVKVSGSKPGSTFGIWNAASIATIDFLQRFQQYEILYREPIIQTETYRLNGLVGPRFVWFWERFRWRTTDIGDDGTSSPQDVGIYTNIVSNRMYGTVVGVDQEYYFGHGIVGHLKFEGATFLDSVKERAQYEMQLKYSGLPQNKRSQRTWTIVPEAQATAGLMWYPTEFVQLYASYEVSAFWNTIASRQPIDFDYANLDPHWSHVGRIMNGMRIGMSISF